MQCVTIGRSIVVRFDPWKPASIKAFAAKTGIESVVVNQGITNKGWEKNITDTGALSCKVITLAEWTAET